MIPMLASFSFRKGLPPKLAHRQEHGWMARMNARYLNLLTKAMEHRTLTVTSALVVLAIALGSLFFIGTELMPRLDEGSISARRRTLSGCSETKQSQGLVR